MTTTRRAIMIHAAAITAAASVPCAARALPRERVALYDPRYSDSRAFAAAMKAQGAATVSLAHDIGDLWRTSLAQTAQRRAQIIGLTRHSDLYISSVFAEEAGLSAHMLGQHDARGRLTLLHTLYSPALSIKSTDANWSAQLASAAPIAHGDSRIVVESAAPRSADFPGTLYSWAIV